MNRALVPIYIVTIFLSAFLLFAVQPMVGKYLLPLLGGTPSVWNTAMVFFQILLLAGYIYAHFLAKLRSIKAQAAFHLSLMLLAALSLPISLSSDLDAPTDQPIAWQLKTMIGMAAAPFLMLSASAPLLQKWFSRSQHPNAENPYFLYAASNIGSILALLSYPVVIEPLLELQQQSIAWAFGYGMLATLFMLCACSLRSKQRQIVSETMQETQPLSWVTRVKWIFLAFCPSSLMLGFTTYITTDIASAPLFWILPLTLYLGTFIIAFSSKPLISLSTTRYIFGFFILSLLCINLGNMQYAIPWFTVTLHTLLFFFTALMCHEELVAQKPASDRLTEFYLLISLGGALGGLFNSLLAPVIFTLPIEYYVVIGLSIFAWRISLPMKKTELKFGAHFIAFPGLIILVCTTLLIPYMLYKMVVAIAVLGGSLCLLNKKKEFIATILVLSCFSTLYLWKSGNNIISTDRNFFGVLRIYDNHEKGVRFMSHGTTTHGAQFLNPALKKIPMTYFYTKGPAGDIFAEAKRKKLNKVAALGLGVGSIACYSETGRSFDFYEIDPHVIRVADDPEYFSYLHDCGSPYKIILGDARKKISLVPDNSYDVIFVDVFSSDNIPVHVITKEAIELYKKKLKKNGLIVVHISNRFFNLKPEIGLLADSIGMHALSKFSPSFPIEKTDMRSTPALYSVMSEDDEMLDSFRKLGWKDIEVDKKRHPWTDGYANIIRAIRF